MDVGRLVSLLESSITEKKGDNDEIIKVESMEKTISKQSEIDTNLQVAREALIALMKHFSTVRPLLRKAMDAYESALGIRNSRLERYINLTNSLLGWEDNVIDPASEIDKMGNRFLDSLAVKQSQLISKIEFLNNARAEQEDCIRKLRKKLADNQEQSKRDLETRRLALRDIEKLERKMILLQKRIKLKLPPTMDADFNTHKMQKMITKTGTPEDDQTAPSREPFLLEKMLHTCETNKRELSKKLCFLRTEYAEAVPLKRFLAAENRVKAMVLEKSKLNKTITALSREKDDLLDSIFNLKRERKSFMDRIQDLENGSSIIASQWKRCANCIPGGVKRWRKLTSGKNNGEILEILVNELEIMAAVIPYYEENANFS